VTSEALLAAGWRVGDGYHNMNIKYGSYSLLNAIYYVAPQVDLF
jgi:hypothetical protein